MTQPRALLDLSTLDESKFILIDGRRFDMVSPNQFGMRQMNRLQRFARLSGEWTEKDFSDEEADELDERLNSALLMIVPSLGDVTDRLSARARMQILQSYFEDAGWISSGEAQAALPNRTARRQTPVK